MNTATTQGVRISVEIMYREDLSDVQRSSHFFNYTIYIKNLNNFPVQLKERSWKIFDTAMGVHFINGQGVVGEQPILDANESYVYTSGCELFSEIGFMEGHYQFKAISPVSSEMYFKVNIPRFELLVPFIKN